MNRIAHFTVALLLGVLPLSGCAGSSDDTSRGEFSQLELPTATATAGAREQAASIIEITAESERPIDRANAAHATLHMEPEQAKALLTSLLNDPDPRVQFAATVNAGRLKITDFAERYRAMADGNDKLLRVGGTFALHRIGDQSTSQRLADYAEDTDPMIRENTARVLGLLDEPSAVRILRPMRGDSDGEVRIAVAEALWRLGDEDGFKQLAGYLVHPDEQVRTVGVSGLAQHNDPRVPRLLMGKLDDVNPYVRLLAADALAKFKDNRGYPLIVEAASAQPTDPAKRDDIIVAESRRALAAAALGDLAQGQADAILNRLLNDESTLVRINAAAAVLKLPSEGAVAASSNGSGR